MEFSKETINEFLIFDEELFNESIKFAKRQIKENSEAVYDVETLKYYIGKLQEKLKITIEEKNKWKENYLKMI